MSKPPTQYVYVHVIQVTIPVGGVEREDVQIKFVVNSSASPPCAHVNQTRLC